MRLAAPAIALALVAGGCDFADAPRARGTDGPAPPPAAAVSAARARLSVATHRGIDSLSGVRIEGTCSAAPVRLEVGHAPPYQPLRRVGHAQIDRLHPPKRARLTTQCRAGRFELERRTLLVRLGTGPLMATPAGGRAVAVRVTSSGLE